MIYVELLDLIWVASSKLQYHMEIHACFLFGNDLYMDFNPFGHRTTINGDDGFTTHLW